MKSQSGSLRRSAALSLVITGASFWLLLRYTWEPESLALLDHFDYRYLALAAALLVASWLVDGLRITLMARAGGYPIAYSQGLRTILVGHFVAAITPFVAGGGPLQAYSLHRSGMSLAASTALVLGQGIIAQALLVVVSFGVALWPDSPLAAADGPLSTLRWLLLAYSVGLSLFFLLIWHAEAGGRKLINRWAGLLKRLGFRQQRVDDISNAVLSFLTELNHSFRELSARRPMVMVYAVIFYGFYFALFFAVAVPLAAGLGSSLSYGEHLIRQIPVYLLVSLLPTPGGSGGMEAGMALAYADDLPDYALGPFVVGWRALTYYGTILVGGLVSANFLRTLRGPAPQLLKPNAGPAPTGSDEGYAA